MEDFQGAREDDGVEDMEVLAPSWLCPAEALAPAVSHMPLPSTAPRPPSHTPPPCLSSPSHPSLSSPSPRTPWIEPPRALHQVGVVEDDAARLWRADAGRMAPCRGWWRREDEQGMAAQLHSGSTAQRRFWSAGRREVEVGARGGATASEACGMEGHRAIG